MAKVEDCPGFETFGEDVRASREALGLTIKALAEQINIDPRYLSEIELKPTIPSIPVILQLVRCRLPIERYFNPELVGEDSAQRQRVSHKLKLCPEKYLPSSKLPLTEQSNWKNRRCFARAKRRLFFAPFYGNACL